MKIKKSKIIVPALAMLLLSTTASVTGTVAWFTANRTYKFNAGDFAVVNTKDNLQASLTSGIGTTANNETKRVTVNTATHVLTDASFDHTAVKENLIIAPDDNGENIKKAIPLTDAIAGAAVNDTYGLLRESGTPNVYTAFTWDVTFKLNFSASASKSVGLFLDLSSANTWAHEVVKIAGHTDNNPADPALAGLYTDDALTTAIGAASAANYFEYVAEGGEAKDGWYTDTDCTEAAAAALTAGTTYYKPGYASGTYYKAAPDNTGRGFRIAFVPKEIPTGSLGVTKVWAPHRNDAREADEEALGIAASGNLKHVDLDNLDNYPTAYSASATYAVGDIVKYSGNTYVCNSAIGTPEEWTAGHWTAVSKANYDEYSAESTYAVGDLVRHEDKLYQCNTAIGVAEAWASAKWTQREDVNLDAKAAAYGTTTTQLVNGTRTTTTVTEAVMDKADDSGLPGSATAKAAAVQISNCLGYFGVNQGSYTELTYTCVAWYEGTDPRIVNNSTTIYETMTTSMEFSVFTLSD